MSSWCIPDLQSLSHKCKPQPLSQQEVLFLCLVQLIWQQNLTWGCFTVFLDPSWSEYACFALEILTFVTEIFPQTSQGVSHCIAHAMYYLSAIWNSLNSDVHLDFRCRKLNLDLLFKRFMYHLVDLKEAGDISAFRCSWIQGLSWDLSLIIQLWLSLLFLECWLHSHSCLT